MGRERKEYQKFKIKRQGSIEENIEKLKKELELELKGAPDILQEGSKTPVQAKKESSKQNFNQYPTSEKKKVSIIRPLIYLGVLIVFITSFLKFPIFKYNTFLKTDQDFPTISFRGVFYYNIFGKKIREYTILIIGKKKVVIPYTYEKWINFPKEKKILILKTYLPEESNF